MVKMEGELGVAEDTPGRVIRGPLNVSGEPPGGFGRVGPTEFDN